LRAWCTKSAPFLHRSRPWPRKCTETAKRTANIFTADCGSVVAPPPARVRLRWPRILLALPSRSNRRCEGK
jgi:hypothetical protein